MRLLRVFPIASLACLVIILVLLVFHTVPQMGRFTVRRSLQQKLDQFAKSGTWDVVTSTQLNRFLTEDERAVFACATRSSILACYSNKTLKALVEAMQPRGSSIFPFVGPLGMHDCVDQRFDDFLRLWNGAASQPKGAFGNLIKLFGSKRRSICFVGDSMTEQLYYGFLWGISREGFSSKNETRVKLSQEPKLPWWGCLFEKRVTEFFELNLIVQYFKLYIASDFDLEAIEKDSTCDIVFANQGLHFNWFRSGPKFPPYEGFWGKINPTQWIPYNQSVFHVVNYLDRVARRGGIAIFNEVTPEHWKIGTTFRDYPDQRENMTCSDPDLFVKARPPQVRNSIIRSITSNKPNVLVFGLHEVYLALSMLHPNPIRCASCKMHHPRPDCSHWCPVPQLYEPVWQMLQIVLQEKHIGP